MNEGIFNDEKIVGELNEKLSEYEAKLKKYEERKSELKITLSDLDKKNSIDGISESTREKIGEVIAKVQEKMNEIDSEMADLSNKIKEINETVNQPEPAAEPEIESISEDDVKLTKLENRKKTKEAERNELKMQKDKLKESRNSIENNEFYAQIEAQIRILEEQQGKFDKTLSAIEEKIDDENINGATRERLEEMRGEVQEKIDEIGEKIEELEDKKGEYEDKINDEIDEINDKIDEINDEIEEIDDEIEEIRTGTIDESVINEIKQSSGFDDISSLFGKITNTVNAALSNLNKSINVSIPKIPDIKIPEINIRIPEHTFSSDNSEKSGDVTFDDIIAIAPFAKKETLDKLVDKLIETDDFSKLKSLAPFLSSETLDKLVSKASGKADFKTIKSLAPFLSGATLSRLVESFDEDMDFDKIKSLAPFLSQETLVKCVTRGGVKIDMKRLKSLAPFLGSDYIDEIISTML